MKDNEGSMPMVPNGT